MRAAMAVALVILALSGCQSTAGRSEETHICVETPNNLVECYQV